RELGIPFAFREQHRFRLLGSLTGKTPCLENGFPITNRILESEIEREKTMDVLLAIISWAVFGLIAGAIARLLVPGRQPIGMLATVGLGIVGSVVGGGIVWAVTGDPMQPAGWIMSIIGAVIVLAIAVKMQGRRRVGA